MRGFAEGERGPGVDLEVWGEGNAGVGGGDRKGGERMEGIRFVEEF